MVNIINAISGGSNELVHTTKRQRQEYYRSASHICSGKYFHLPWSHIPITFTAADIQLQHYPHNDPLVISANIGKNTKYYFDNDIGRVLVDNGSSADGSASPTWVSRKKTCIKQSTRYTASATKELRHMAKSMST
jgi:hypothetical protein